MYLIITPLNYFMSKNIFVNEPHSIIENSILNDVLNNKKCA